MTTLLQTLKPHVLTTDRTDKTPDDLIVYTHLLRIILWQMFIFVCIEAASELLQDFTTTGAMLDVMLLGNVLIAIGLLRRGRTRLASIYGVFSQLLFVSLDLLFSESFNPFHACKFALVIIIAGLLFEHRSLIAVVVLCSIVTLTGMYFAEIRVTTANPWLNIINLFGHSYVLLYVSSGVIVGVFTRYLRQMVAKVSANNTLLQEQIKQREQAESAIKQLNSDLETRVRQRTAELSIANHELESFAYSVSHDLRAPLRGIDGWSLALLEDYNDKLDDMGRDYLAQVRKETQRMSELIDDILELSRITRSEMRRERVDLSQLAQTILTQTKKQDPLRQVEVMIQPDVVVTGDSHLLRQVLENLLSNAWKFTSKKERARIEFGCENGAYFVRDDGAGFDMAYANKLFAPFQRLHRISEYAGTGVGLAIVQRILHRHCGDIWAESKINAGTTFYFKLQ